MTEKNLIQGNNSNNRLDGTEGDDRIEGLGSWDILNGNGGNDELIGGAGLDRLHGGTGSDVLNGTDEINAGAGERDYLSGGAGADTFILGDANKVYYIDSGNLDFVRIQDFELGVDKVQLPGHPSDYHMDGNKLCLANGELIAVFDHLDTIDLYSDDFIFIKDGNGGNTAPNANNDSSTTEFNTPVSINVLGNDSDPDGDALSVTSVEGQSISAGETIDTNNGSVTLLNNGQLEFTPDRGFTGNESFSYHISDDNGGEDTALVSVDVQPKPIPKTGTIIGSSHITEGSKAHYQVKLDGVVHEDTYVTIKINNGTAKLADDFRLDRVDYLSNPSTFNVKLGEKGQLYTANNSDRYRAARAWNVGFTGFSGSLYDVNVGVKSLTDDFQVSGAVGNHLVVKINAGSDTSNSFRIDALKEIQFGKYFSGITKTESTENFSLTIDQIGDHDVNTGHKTINIKDNYAVYSPIAFDLNGNGIETLSIDEGVEFDMLNTGSAVNTGWLSGDDGFLAIDNDGDGLISSRDELFGGAVGEGFAKLESFDSNGDGLVNESDDRFGELLLWQDGNENGITDAGELVSLESTGITDLNTSYTNVFAADAQGNIHGEHSTAVMNSSTMEMVDVYFQVELG